MILIIIDINLTIKCNLKFEQGNTQHEALLQKVFYCLSLIWNMIGILETAPVTQAKH